MLLLETSTKLSRAGFAPALRKSQDKRNDPMTSPVYPAATQSNLARTVLRLAVGVVFFAHGWQKIF
jgi:hypothetical protein